MGDVRMPEDAALGKVRAAGPDGFRRTVLQADDEFVVSDVRLVRPSLARESSERGRGHGRPVLVRQARFLRIVRRILARVIDDLHVRPVRRGADHVKKRPIVEFVGGDQKGVPLWLVRVHEGGHRFIEPARQPDKGLVVLDEVRRAIAKAANIGLRCGDAAVEIDVMITALGAFGRDGDRCVGERGEGGRCALSGGDLVGVSVPRLGAVVRPLEALDGVIVRRIGRAGRKARIGLSEGLHPFEEIGLVFRVVGSVDGETEQAITFAFRHVEAEEYHVGAGDDMERKRPLLHALAHRRLPRCFR